VQEYERGVIFRLGRCVGAKGPGLFYILPFFVSWRKVNLQSQAVAGAEGVDLAAAPAETVRGLWERAGQ
jgi:regulator of protease activity HflC (stomatin/prohibitin superfamily)